MEWEAQGQRLKQLREAQGVSRHKLGVAIGRTSQTVFNWEQGKIRPSIEMIVQLGDILGGKAELLEAYGYTIDRSLIDEVAALKRQVEEQGDVIARLIDAVGLGVTVKSNEVARRRKS